MLSNNPSTHPLITEEIERYGLTWHLDPQYDVGLTNPKKRVQVREAEHYAPRENVKAMAAQMGQSPNFPPIVMTEDDYIVDGNTRIGAWIFRKQKFFPAIIVEVAYEGLKQKQKMELHALAATLNQMGGQRLTHAEVVKVTTDLVSLGWTADRIARAVGASPSVVWNTKKKLLGAARLTKIGMDPTKLSEQGVKALGHETVQNLNDVPFRELATLQRDAGLREAEVSALAKELKAIGDDTGKMTKLAEARAESAQRIREYRLTGNGLPPPSAQLRRSLGYTLKFLGNEAALVEASESAVDTHIQTLEDAVTVLTRALDRQKAQ